MGREVLTEVFLKAPLFLDKIPSRSIRTNFQRSLLTPNPGQSPLRCITLKQEAVRLSETLLSVYKFTQRHITGDRHFQQILDTHISNAK